MNIFKLGIMALALSLTTVEAAPPASNTVLTLTSDNNLIMDSVFTSEAVAGILIKAQELDSKLPSAEPIYLILYSPGGSIQAGLELIDGLKALNRPVHTITLFAASMGFQTVQGLGKRYITHFGTLMAHKASGGFSGEFPGQIDSRYVYYLKRLAELDRIAAARTGGKLSPESLRSLYENEYWVDGFGATEKGLADEVVTVKCDQSLVGTRTVPVQFMGLTIDLVLSKCPTITGIIDAVVNVHTDQGVMPLRDFLAKGGSLTGTAPSRNSYYDDDNEVTKIPAPRLNVPSLSMEQIEEAINKAKSARKLQPVSAVKGMN